MQWLETVVMWTMEHKTPILWTCIAYCCVMFTYGLITQIMQWRMRAQQKTMPYEWAPWQTMSAAVVMALPAVIFLL